MMNIIGGEIMKDALSIHEILQTLKKRLALITLITVGIVVIAAIISYYILTPKYQSSSQFIVIQQQNENIQFSINDIETNLELINTYTEIIKSPFILEEVIAKLKLSVSLKELGKQIKVASGENSQVVTVSAIGESPEEAAQLANVVVQQFKNTIPTIMNIENVFVLTKANAALSQEPVAPRPIINLIVAGVIGLATSIGLALSLEFLNTKVKTESDIEELGIIVLGTISVIDKKRKKRHTNTNYVLGKEENLFETKEG